MFSMLVLMLLGIMRAVKVGARRLLPVLVVVGLVGTARASTPDSIVMLEGCSGVCVDRSGLVLTVKHCQLPETVQVRFKDRTVWAKRVYVSSQVEGPVVFDCEGDGYPFSPVAASTPQFGERLWSYGYPSIQNRRELRWATGHIVRWSTFEYRDGSFTGNVVDFGTCPGWSGGPLLNAKGEVCGLLNSTDGKTSVFVSSAAVRDAYAQTRSNVNPHDSEGRTKLIVFGSMTCTPCREFKNDYRDNDELSDTLEAAFAIEFVDVDEQPAVAKRYGIKQVPAFLVPGRDPIVGYQGADRLLVALGLTVKNVEPIPETKKPDVPAPTEVDVEPVRAEKPVVPTAPPATPEPETNPVHAEQTPQTDAPTPTATDPVDRLSGIVERAVTVATWLGVGGLTGGTGGLILGGIAVWRSFRKRRRRVGMAREPPTHKSSTDKPPLVVTVDSPPPPQVVLSETRFAPYERDTFSEAFSWAEVELARKYPGSVGTLESLRGLINQFLAAKSAKSSSHHS